VEEAGFIAGHLGIRYGVPYIFDMHSWMSQQLEDGGYLKSRFLLDRFRAFESRTMNRARAIVTVGPEMTEALKRLAPGVPACTLPDLPLTFDEVETPGLENPITRRFFPPGRKTIVYTGNFHPYQGIDLLIESIRHLKQGMDGQIDFTVLLVGGGPAEARTVARYQRMAADLGVEREIVFCGEHPAEAMPVFMKHADLLVSSRITGNNVPLKVYTYLASGRLLVATNIPSHTQVLNEENCLLADPEPEALARALYRGLVDITVPEKERLTAIARQVGGVEQRQKFSAIVQECYEFCTGTAAS
jgi:glycosyltransferase involved in cell wall biosynthesis